MPEVATTLSGERLRTAEAVFEAVVDLRLSERSAELERRCGGDAELRGFVERLLENAERGPGTFLETTFASAALQEANALAGPLPSRIGPYEIVAKIGEGGMGVVYEARQDSPRRTVALKLIRPGFASPTLLRRFQFEADVLGQLQHPGIAHIYEAGIADGVAYFAMELIRGRPLNTYVANAQLNPRAIIELLIQIADAVHHAHQKGVIHRDLKPGNILVVEEGSGVAVQGSGALRAASSPNPERRMLSPQPKILDFGVARVIRTDAVTLSMHTEAGQLVGTVPYMSPEQVTGESHQLDVRSDVYALGVILFELLTGRLPLEVRNCTLIEAARIIREEEPSRLGRVAGRSTVATRFDRDLETIVAKALEKDRERRYQSAAELATDLRRYLRDEPIAARPASAMYQLRKFAKRHRAIVAGLAATVAALVMGLIGTSWFALAEREQRGKVESLLVETRKARDSEKIQRAAAEASSAAAEESAAETTAVLSFLLDDVIGATEPQAGGHAVTVVEALDASVADIDTRFADRPRVAVMLHEKMADMYRSLGQYDAGVREAERAVELAATRLSADDPQIIQVQGSLVDAFADARRWDEALVLARQVADAAEKRFGFDAKLTLTVSTALADALQVKGEYAEAEAIVRRVYDRARERFPDQPIVFRALNVLNASVEGQGRVDEGLRREEYEGTLRTAGPSNPLTLVALNNYAVCLMRLDKLTDSERLLRDAATDLERLMAPNHPLLGEVYHNLSTTQVRQMKPVEAAKYAMRAVEILSASMGERDAATQRSRRQAVRSLLRAGRFDDAQQFLRDAIAGRVKAGDPPNLPDLLHLRAETAWGLAEYAGDCESAERWVAEAQPAGPGPLDGRDSTDMFCHLARAWCAWRAGRIDEAAALIARLRAAADASPEATGAYPVWVRGSCDRLAAKLSASQPASQPVVP